jgi:hypothetical protein
MSCLIAGRSCQNHAVAGPIILVVVILLVLPPVFLISGMVVSALLGWLLTERAEQTHDGSELIDLNT